MKRLRRLLPNLAELNAILIFIGFAVFTQLVYGHEDDSVEFRSQGSFYSIIYRFVCLIVSVLLIYFNWNRRKLIVISRVLKSVIVLYILMSIKLLYAFFLSSYSNLWTTDVINTRLMFVFGVTFIPLYSLVLSFSSINWKKVLLYFVCLLTSICLSTLVVTAGMEGRINLNSHQSTLAFGAYSAYLLIISVCFFREFRTSRSKIIMLITASVGFVGLLQAGSRGPLLGALVALFPLFFLGKKKGTFLFITIITLIFLGPIIYSELESFAPVIFKRLEDGFNGDESTMARLTAFDLAIEQMANYPIFGESPLFYTRWAYGFGPHNLPLQVGMGLGVLGFIWVCILYLSFLKDALRHINTNIVTDIFASLLIYFLIRSLTGVDFYSASDFGFVIIVFYLNLNKIQYRKN